MDTIETEDIDKYEKLIRKKVYGPQCPVGRQPAKDDEDHENGD